MYPNQNNDNVTSKFPPVGFDINKLCNDASNVAGTVINVVDAVPISIGWPTNAMILSSEN